MSNAHAGPSNVSSSSTTSSDRPATLMPDDSMRFMFENYPATQQAAVDFNRAFGLPEDMLLPSFFDLTVVEYWATYSPPDPTPTLYSEPRLTGYTYPLLFDYHMNSFRHESYTYASGLDLWCCVTRIRRSIRKVHNRVAEAPSPAYQNALILTIQELIPFLVSFVCSRFRILTDHHLLALYS
jgi:hypothetical protein